MATGHQPQGRWPSRPPLSVAPFAYAPWAQNLGQQKAPPGEIRKNPAASDDEPKTGSPMWMMMMPLKDPMKTLPEYFVGLMVAKHPIQKQ